MVGVWSCGVCCVACACVTVAVAVAVCYCVVVVVNGEWWMVDGGGKPQWYFVLLYVLILYK